MYGNESPGIVLREQILDVPLDFNSEDEKVLENIFLCSQWTVFVESVLSGPIVPDLVSNSDWH